MKYTNFDEKDKSYYMKTFMTEAQHNLNFYKVARENHQKNIKRLRAEIEDEERAILENEGEIATINAKLNDPDGSGKKLLFRDFKSVIGNLLNGEEAQPNGRFGLKIQRQGPYIIQKPYSVSKDGRRTTETRTVAVTKHRNNQEALEKFQAYLRTGYSLDIDNMSFEQLKDAIEKFSDNAPKADIYGEEYESESPYSESTKVKGGDSLFRI